MRNKGYVINHKTIQKLMNILGLKGKQRKNDKYQSEKAEITEIFNENKGRYGYRRITALLKANGHCINHKTVLKLMKALDLKGKQRKNY